MKYTYLSISNEIQKSVITRTSLESTKLLMYDTKEQAFNAVAEKAEKECSELNIYCEAHHTEDTSFRVPKDSAYETKDSVRVEYCYNPYYKVDGDTGLYTKVLALTQYHIIELTEAPENDPARKYIFSNEIAEMKGQIVDIFEDYFEKNDIYVPNPDRDYAYLSTKDENFAIIYGEDYDLIADAVELDYEYEKIKKRAENIYKAAEKLLSREYAEKMRVDKDYLLEKITSTLTNWSLYITGKYADAFAIKKIIVDHDIDMYNLTTGAYVFHYNSKEAIAVYYMTAEQAENLAKLTEEAGEDYWGALLGAGGTIYDDPMTFLMDHGNDKWVKADKDFKAVQ